MTSYASQDGRSRQNNTTTALGASQTFTGEWEANNLDQVLVTVLTDKSGTLYIDFSSNQQDYHSHISGGTKINAGEYKQVSAIKGKQYTRVRFVNDDEEQTSIVLFTYYGDNLVQEEADTAQLTSFGEMSVAENYPFVQGSATYGLIPANFREFTATGGSTGTEDRLFKVSTGTSVGGYGAIQSFRSVNSKIGQSVLSRFSGYFTSSVENSWQGIGLISIGDELSFGYDGTDFGVWHRYGGLAEVRTITVTTPSSGSTNLTLTLNSVAYTIPLTSGTAAHNAYQIAAWLNSNQSVWEADQLGSTVIINASSDGAKSGTYSYAHATSAGTITQNTAGVTKTSVHIPQSDWNINTYDSLDPSKGNVYQIIYQNMGYGEVLFYVEDRATSQMRLVHVLRSTNITTTRVLGNPSLRCGMYAASVGSTTNLDVYADSFVSFTQGKPIKTRNPRSVTHTQTLSTTNETNILTLRNRKTYNGYVNQVEIEPLRLTIASEINKNVIIRIRAIENTGVEQNFANVGTNLVSDVDKTAVAFSAGRFLDGITIPPTGGDKVNLKELEIQIPPSLNLVITGQRTGGSSGAVTATLTYYEDL